MTNKEKQVIKYLAEALDAAENYPKKKDKNKIVKNISLALAATDDLD